MKDFLLLATYSLALLEFALGCYFIATNSKSEVRRVVAVLCVSTSFWVLCSALIAYRNDSYVLPINAAIYCFGVILVTTILYLAVLYPIPIIRFDRLHKILLYVPAGIFSIIAITTRLLELDYVQPSPNNSGQVVSGPLLPIYNTYLLILFLAAIFVLFRQLKRTHGFLQTQVKVLIAGLILGGLPAITIDLIMPIVNHGILPNFLYGVLSTVLWVAATSYIILKT